MASDITGVGAFFKALGLKDKEYATRAACKGYDTVPLMRDMMANMESRVVMFEALGIEDREDKSLVMDALLRGVDVALRTRMEQEQQQPPELRNAGRESTNKLCKNCNAPAMRGIVINGVLKEPDFCSRSVRKLNVVALSFCFAVVVPFCTLVTTAM